MKSFKDLREKTLTPAEKKKREEIAKAKANQKPEKFVKPHPEVIKAYKKKLAADDKAADWNYGGSKARLTRATNHLTKKIDQHHPGLDTQGRIELYTTLQNMKEAVEEKKLTPAELKKREEIAKAMERDNPGMDMKKKMAIATWQAKKVAEQADSSMCCKHCGDEFGKPTNEKCMYDAYDPKGKNWVKKESYNEAKVDEISLSHLSNKIANSTGTKNIKTAMKPGEVKKGLDDLKKRLATLGQDPKMAKEAYEEEPASPDEKSMAMRQAKFIQYVGDEIMEHLEQDGDFPEWMQNKLSEFHQKAKDMHSTMAGSYEDDDENMKEGYRVHAVSKDGEKMKSGLHPTKKAASDMHYKMAKSGMYKKIEVVKETAELDEAKRKGAPKMQGDFLKKERERNRAHDAAMGRTPTGRKKPVRTMTSTQRSLAKLRNEEAQLDEISKKTLGSYVKKASANIASTSADNARDYATGNRPVGINKKGVKIMKRTKYVNKAVDKMTQEGVQSADKKPEKYVKPDGKVGIRMVRTDKKVVDKDA